jgi:RNA polymerase sigma-70 factor (ECF subfamily)
MILSQLSAPQSATKSQSMTKRVRGFFGSSDPDGPLLARARKGDRAAFDALVSRHGGALRAFLARRVGSEMADDVAQEVWIACWRNLATNGPRGRFKAWLYGVATHKAADALRSLCRQREREAEPEAGESVAAPDAFGPLETKDAVEKILASLPDAQREVVELYYFAELTLAEIAAALGRNLNTVKYQFYRAHALGAESGNGDDLS